MATQSKQYRVVEVVVVLVMNIVIGKEETNDCDEGEDVHVDKDDQDSDSYWAII